ncbi:MAG: hypothetical protein LBF43_02750 [Puniceicoccales bacterium]|jgi:hypothetical protein|nr:hypothetical protein [Puniceicoccales bacterium]
MASPLTGQQRPSSTPQSLSSTGSTKSDSGVAQNETPTTGIMSQSPRETSLVSAATTKPRTIFSRMKTHKAEQEAARQKVLNDIQNTALKSKQGPGVSQISDDVAHIKALLVAVSQCSSKHQPQMYDLILQKMNEGTPRPEFLTLLNQQAASNPQIVPTRNAYLHALLDNYQGMHRISNREYVEQYDNLASDLTKDLSELDLNTQRWAFEKTTAEVHQHTEIIKTLLEVEKSLPPKQQKIMHQPIEHVREKFQNQLADIIKHPPIPNTSPEGQQIFLALLKGISQCSLSTRPTLLHSLHDQLQKSVEQANPASEVNKLLLQQMNLGIEAMGLGNNPQKLITAEKQFLSNCIDYSTKQLNSLIDNQQTKQLLVTSEIFSQITNLTFPTAEPKWPCNSKNDVQQTVQFNFFQHITRLPLLIREIRKGTEKADQNYLWHALEEFKTKTAQMKPMLELAQARVDGMSLKELNEANSEIISAVALPTDEKYGITSEMRQRAGGTN